MLARGPRCTSPHPACNWLLHRAGSCDKHRTICNAFERLDKAHTPEVLTARGPHGQRSSRPEAARSSEPLGKKKLAWKCRSTIRATGKARATTSAGVMKKEFRYARARCALGGGAEKRNPLMPPGPPRRLAQKKTRNRQALTYAQHMPTLRRREARREASSPGVCMLLAKL